jgi:pyridoxamine 5'-phosphate oxidase
MSAMHPELLHSDPLEILTGWLEEARAAGEPEPEAMALATATPDGRPSVRMVLLRGIDRTAGVLRFFTNYQSRKGHELEQNPYGAVAIYWNRIGRQVRVEGRVARLSPADSDAYFRARPHGHQIGAWASPQSRRIESFEELRVRYEELSRTYAGREVPRPPHWGGYGLSAERVELWIRGLDRMHERYLFERGAGTRWEVSLLGS